MPSSGLLGFLHSQVHTHIQLKKKNFKKLRNSKGKQKNLQLKSNENRYTPLSYLLWCWEPPVPLKVSATALRLPLLLLSSLRHWWLGMGVWDPQEADWAALALALSP